MSKRKAFKFDRATLAPLAAVAVLCLVALAILENTIEGLSPSAAAFVRGAQRGIIQSFLLTVAGVGILRLALGLAIGGPALWGLTAAAFVVSGGYNRVAEVLGMPRIGGGGSTLNDGDSPIAIIPPQD